MCGVLDGWGGNRKTKYFVAHNGMLAGKPVFHYGPAMSTDVLQGPHAGYFKTLFENPQRILCGRFVRKINGTEFSSDCDVKSRERAPPENC